jgi:hypothetical protein
MNDTQETASDNRHCPQIAVYVFVVGNVTLI